MYRMIRGCRTAPAWNPDPGACRYHGRWMMNGAQFRRRVRTSRANSATEMGERMLRGRPCEFLLASRVAIALGPPMS
jgi:hypothetical protein